MDEAWNLIKVTRRGVADDWDGDGWRNDDDPDDPPSVGVSVSFSKRAIIFEHSGA